MKSLPYRVLVVLAGVLLASAGVQAQNAQAQPSQTQDAQTEISATQGSNATDAKTRAQQSPAVMDAETLAEWEESIRDRGGLRAEYMLTEEIFGPEGEEIGNVENIIVNGQGQIVAIIAEVGGFWDIGDTHIAVPWEEVTLIPDGLKIPVTEDNFDDYTLFAEKSYITMERLQQARQVDDSVATGPETWRLTALLGDYAALENGDGFGYVDDAIFSKDGQLQAVIVQSSLAAYGYGTYAFPFHGYAYGWRPYQHAYVVPYGPAVIDTLEPFRYDDFNGYWL